MQLHLEHHRPEKNRLRFYALEVGQDLFGAWVVTRRWGRIGQSERRVAESFVSESAAIKLARDIKRQKETRGYVLLPEQLDLPL